MGRVGFIGGGVMGTALATGMSVESKSIVFYETSNERRKKLEELGFSVGSLADVHECEYVVIAVKPSVVPSLIPSLRKDKVYMSVVAGTPISTYGMPWMMRLMPTTAVSLGEGTICYALSTALKSEPRTVDTILGFLESCGHVTEIDERYFDIATAITGSGIAFAYSLIDAMADAGVEGGMTYKESKRLAAQTVVGAGKKVLASDDHPMGLRSEVASPGGTTIAGLAALEHGGFKSCVLKACQAACNRSKEL